MPTPTDFLEKPSPCVGPVAFGGGYRHAQHLGRLFQRQPDKIAQLHELRLAGIMSGETIQGLMYRQQFVIAARRRNFDEGIVDIDALQSAAVPLGPAPTGAFN